MLIPLNLRHQNLCAISEGIEDCCVTPYRRSKENEMKIVKFRTRLGKKYLISEKPDVGIRMRLFYNLGHKTSKSMIID